MKKKLNLINYFSVIILSMSLISCGCQTNFDDNFPDVYATSQTKSVDSEGDAADDPAIWYNDKNAANSRIIATDKQKGLGVYNLQGKLLSFKAVGRINNCDVQYQLEMGSEKIDIIGGSNRTDNTVSIYRYNKQNSTVDSIAILKIPSLSEEIYGFCFYKNPDTQEIFSISIGKDGLLEQNLIFFDGQSVKYKNIRNYKFDGQCEGLVADHKNGVLFIGEEDLGIWKLNLRNRNSKKELVCDVKIQKEIIADVEGLTIYYAKNEEGYLLASSQGNNSYAIFNRKSPHQYIGSFRIGDGNSIDGTCETDGIDVINLHMGSNYPKGFFIAQDGENETNGKENTQNFKIVPWEEVALSSQIPLLIDNQYIGY